MSDNYDDHGADLAAKDTEIERLREEAKDRSDLADEAMELVHEQEAEIERLRGLLADAPCTCPNSPPWDWPHDPHNEDCYLNRVREALGE